MFNGFCSHFLESSTGCNINNKRLKFLVLFCAWAYYDERGRHGPLHPQNSQPRGRKSNAKPLVTDPSHPIPSHVVLSSVSEECAELQTSVCRERVSEKTTFKFCFLENYQARQLGWESMASTPQTSLFMPITWRSC